MNEQKLLFRLEQEVWIERLWSRVPATTRRQIVLIIADMANAALTERDGAEPEEVPDER